MKNWKVFLQNDVNLKEPTTELLIELMERGIFFFLKDNPKREAEQQAAFSNTASWQKEREGNTQATFPVHNIKMTVPGQD